MRDAPDQPPVHASAELSLFSNAELVQQSLESILAFARTPRWSLQRWRSRHTLMQAHRALSDGVLAHVGPHPGLCDHCALCAPTSHVLYGPHTAPRFAHYCRVCAPLMPLGWFCASTSSPVSSSPTAR